MTQKIALITGANRGIGFEICRQLGKLGMQVILTSRNEDRGEAAAKQLSDEGLNVVFHRLDITQSTDVVELRKFVELKFGHLDVLVNNAGIYLDEGVSVLDVSLDTLCKSFEVNTFGAFLMCQEFVPMMRDQNYGRVVNMSSGAGQITGMKGYTGAYKMSKVALNALTRILANELRLYNIKVNAVCPGWVQTDMGGPAAPRTVEEGAETAVWLATLPDDGPTNGFFRDRQPINW